MLYEFNNTDLLPTFSTEFEQTIKRFSNHDLSGLNNSSLMNRVDSKFLLPIDALLQVLNSCNAYYSLLKIDKVSVFQYNNIYFDSSNLNFYNNHHNGKLNRHKVRHRHYADVGTSFLEVKYKNNKGRTIKNRTIADQDPIIALTKCNSFLSGHSIDPTTLLPAQACNYQRISLANDAEKERLTIDFNIKFENKMLHATADDNFSLSNFFIAELKQEKLDRESPFYRLMRSMGIRSSGFSKYCMGQSLTNNKHIKSNRFKKNLIKLKKGA